MDIFFEVLEKTNSSEKALDAVKKALLKRKLDIHEDDRSYGEVKTEFEKLLALLEKERILGKLMNNKPRPS